MAKLLLVEDEPETAESTVDALESVGHIVEWVATKGEGTELLLVYNYDLIILDWNLGSESGLDLCREYRAKGGLNPILMLTGKSSVADKVAGLDQGADDYLPKPFDVAELNARVSALLRRPKSSYVTQKSGDLEIDSRRGVVIRKGEEIAMRNLELALLSFLMRYPDQYFSSNELLNRVWSGESESGEEAVRKTINRIRQKLDTNDSNYIANVKNLGYKINLFGHD